jgi:hypothetical protein
VLAGLLWTLLLLYGLGALAAIFAPHTRGALPEKGRVDPLFSHVATVVSRTDTEVRCWSHAAWKQNNVEWHRRWAKLGPLGYWRGYTYPTYPPVVNLPPNVCNALWRLAHEDLPAQKDPLRETLAWAAGMLAHEAQHARGILNEAMAECYGMQRIRQTAVALGRSSAEGRYLARLYWKHWYSEDNSVYGSRWCRNRGRLDLRPHIDVWP